MSGLQRTSVDCIIISDIRRVVWLIETVEDGFQRDLDCRNDGDYKSLGVIEELGLV